MDLLLSKPFDYAVKLLKEEVVYPIFYKRKVKELDDYVDYLRDARDRVHHQVESEQRNGKEIEAEVEKWLETAAKIIAEHEKFQEAYDKFRKANAGCSNCLLPNPWSRYILGKKAYEMAQQVNELQKKSKFDGVSYCLTSMSMEFVLSNIGYESFKSRNATKEKIMEALKDSSVRIIGVYGLGGVGKTTLVKNIANQALKSEMFNKVVMATVTRNPNQKKIQGQVADQLGLRLDEESEIGRAGRLRERLKKEKENTLVILDDLWVGLDLNKLGIPFDDGDFGQRTVRDEGMPSTCDYNFKKEKAPVDQRTYKILLTSRFKEVLSSQMDVNENSIFSIEVLREKEAEALFKKVAGVSNKNSVFESLAAAIAKKCEGLPIAIVTVGRALKGKSQSEWNDALRQLERQEFAGIRESLDFSTKLSFDHLESEELKSTFLLCAQMGHHPLVVDLMKYCIGLGIFHGIQSIKEARDRTYTLIGKLAHSSLLLDRSGDSFNMHDMVRDVALSIASKERNVFMMRDGKPDEWPDKDELERYTSISLHNCDIVDDIPEGVTFPQLKVFHVDGGDPFLRIPGDLKGLRKLRVLILTGLHLLHLPFSIECLANLRMLCLECCLLRDTDNLSIIGGLKKLRILSFSGSKIEKLPSELGQLSKLQLFDISDCSNLQVIPRNLISCLSSLEELYMRNSPVQWGVEGQTNESENATLAELSHLHQLTTIDVCISSAAVFPSNLFLDKLDSYKIVIGDLEMPSEGDFKMPEKHERSRALILQLKEGINIHTHKGIKVLFRRVEKLLLGDLHGVKNVFYELNLEGFPCLKHFSIVNNIDVRCIIDSKEMSHPQDAFPNLQSLCLYKLENLEALCCSKLTDSSFSKLKSIKIKVCAQLKKIFPFSMVRLLKKLETIEVSECDYLEKIVVAEENTKIEFPQLRSLALQSLPAFISFYTIDHVVATPPSIFSEQLDIPKLENLELSSINIQSDQPSLSFRFQNLTKLNIRDCNGLTYLFPFSEAKNLKNLKSLSVSGCDKMEKIFMTGEINANEAKVGIFPNLEEIQLTRMESLTTIWDPQLSRDSFPSLGTVVIEECGQLVTIFPHYMVGRFCRLEKLEIGNCSALEEIFDLNLKDAPQIDGKGNETQLRFVDISELPNLKNVWNKDPEGILNFKNLQRISVYNCPNLVNLFPISVARGLNRLECLQISSCNKSHEIVWQGEFDTGSIPFKFPQLTDVFLSELPELESFYGGRHNLEWPALKELAVYSCDKLKAFATADPNKQPIFLPEKVISNLELMAITQKEAEKLQRCIGNYRMHGLKELQLLSFKSIEILYWFLHRIPNLEKLVLYQCLFKEVLHSGSLAAHEKIGTVVQIKELFLFIPVLENIGFERDPVFQRVELLFLYQCSNLISLAPSSVSFTHLRSLEVVLCNKLLYLMASSTAKSLVGLTTMRIIECEAIEEIVANQTIEEERADKHEIVFRKLTTLELVSLPHLISFCNSKDINLNFPVLEKFIVRGCPKMKIFSEGLTTAPILRQVSLAYAEEDEGKWFWERDLSTTIRKISSDMVFLKYAEDLELEQYPELEGVWQGQVSLLDNHFCNLKTLKVSNCDFLSSVIPFHLLAYLKKLEELRVSNCNLVEVIFDMNDNKMTKIGGKAFRLKTLGLDDLPNLKHIWNKDPQGLISFHNLQDVHVEECKRLKTLFPKSVAKNLLKLQQLDIKSCRELEELVGKGDATTDGAIDEMFEFPRLATLELSVLPELKCFYPGRFNLKCPILKDLFVYHCGRLEIFISESRCHEEIISQDQIISTEAQPLFSVQEVIPILREVTLSEKDIKKLWSGGFQQNLDNLKWLRLQCFHNVNKTDHLPYEILVKVPNVETLAIRCSGFKEIFLSEIPEDYNITKLAQLKRLELWNLPQLNSIGSKNYLTDPILKNLEVLTVEKCPCLTKLGQSSLPFPNLKELTIEECDGLLHLFTPSTAKSLVRLQKIHIKGCESIKEIVADERDESDSPDEIIFEQLRELYLDSLLSLANFYPGSSTLKIPYLEQVSIIECPRMKTFSDGVVEAPELVEIKVSTQENDSLGMHDLKSAVDKLFNEKVSFAFIKNLKLSDYPELQPLWLGKIPLPENCFSKLKTLMVENCEFLSNVIPYNLFPCFKNLEELRVRNCSSVEVIFDINGIETSETEERAFLLEKLTLDQLPNLKLVWNKNPQGILDFQKLQKLKVNDCESLRYLFPAASMAKHLLKLKIQYCGALAEVFGKEDTASEASKTLEFPYLTTVILNHLPVLNCFCSGRLHLKCPMLKVLNVYHCGKLEIYTTETKRNQVLPGDKVGVSVNATPVFLVEEVIPKLEEVSINEKETKTLWHEELEANFLHNIKCLQLYCFHSVGDQEGILPYGFLHRVPNMEVLSVACSDFKEIFPSSGLKDVYIRMIAKLKGLHLEALSKLNSIGMQHSWLVPLNKNLETLEIHRCSALTYIVQSPVCFSNLKQLTVTKCHKLIYLFTSSTARNLVRLRRMSVEKCESMGEIVAREEKESTINEIVFGELTKLSLNNLPKVGSFYTGNSPLRFPYLQEVIIAKCSKFEVFSEGLVRTPQLHSIQTSLEKEDMRWEGDLNSTVKKLFKGKDIIVDA